LKRFNVLRSVKQSWPNFRNGGSDLLFRNSKRRVLVLAAGLAAAALVLAGCATGDASSDGSSTGNGSDGSGESEITEPVDLSWLVDNGEATVVMANALVDAFKEIEPNITITIETREGGAPGDNLVKTRLATGEMNDLLLYNTGSLFQAINPSETLVPITNESFAGAINESFTPTVTAGGDVFGVPIGTAMGGGILYNKKVYADLGLTVPVTWDEFMANNAAIKAAGIDPVIQTYGETWTSQLFVLGDYHNVEAAEPGFWERYTNNEAKYADTPAAARGFEYLQQLHELGYYNRDYTTATFNDGLVQLANGTGAHYPMLSFAIASVQELVPDAVNDIGFFAQPGPSADTNGLTVWTSAGLYISATSPNIDAAKKFLAFVATPEACDVQTAAIGATGPYFIAGCELPDDLVPVVTDMLPYFERAGGTTPALEFLSPIKGPALEQITVAVGTGQYTAAEGAQIYDEDVVKQAQQLGLPGW
jgi:raffinose/stachyose/melibiose transport system substrate-binding protein